MQVPELTYDELQQLIHSEYTRMGIGIMPLDTLRESAHYTPRLIAELCAQYFLAGISAECPDENIKQIAHQYQHLNDTGVFDVRSED